MDDKLHPNQDKESEKKQGQQAQAKEEQKKVEREQRDQKARPMVSRRVFSKRWVYPAVYLGAAAVIIGLMYIKSQMGGSQPVSQTTQPSSVPASVTQAEETFTWPVAQGVTPKVTVGYFPTKGTTKQQAHALVSYNQGWYAHEGYDIVSGNHTPFTVVASLSGKVTQVQSNPLYGKTVQIDSGNGYSEQYQSLGSVNVQVGDMVTQGQAIGTSGTNQFEHSQGNHLYFAVFHDGQSINPGSVLPKH